MNTGRSAYADGKPAGGFAFNLRSLCKAFCSGLNALMILILLLSSFAGFVQPVKAAPVADAVESPVLNLGNP